MRKKNQKKKKNIKDELCKIKAGEHGKSSQ